MLEKNWIRTLILDSLLFTGLSNANKNLTSYRIFSIFKSYIISSNEYMDASFSKWVTLGLVLET